MAQREEKWAHKKKKKDCYESEFGEFEHLRNMNESKAFYRKINKNCKEFQPRTTLCMDKKGINVSGNELIMKRWTEHFNELLNSNVTGTSEDIGTINNSLDVELEESQQTIT
jgi:NAD dependent epimerase/dehydratase family enzyme